MNLKPYYNQLEKNLGAQGWMTIGTWAQSPFQVIWSAILIQNASANNADAAAADLFTQTKNDPALIRGLSVDELAEIIKPAGLYQTKAKYIKAAADWLKQYNDDVKLIEQMSREELQSELIGVKGFGNETGDDILMYAFHKPVFIVDTYAKRQFEWMEIDMPKDYRKFQVIAEDDWQLNWDEAQELHALIDTFGKQVKNQKQWDESMMAGFTLK